MTHIVDGEQAAERIKQQFPDAVTASGSYADQHWVEIAIGSLVEIARWLRDDPANDYDFLTDVTAVHWPDEPQAMQMVYHLYSFSRNDTLRLKTRVGEGESVPSLASLWRSADWNERETYDMFGIRFEDHPDLRRILMPDDYTDFPLRKEFPLYRG